tara:strand:+ start:43 stop:546 length:504 start_codon:yes stop_codon:yes gene_type:complete
MKLIKTEIMSVKRGREKRVYKSKTYYRKYWNYSDNIFGTGMSIKEHVEIVNKLFPGYILRYKVSNESMWIDYKIVSGIPASNKTMFPRTKEFIKKIYNFCIENMKETAPYFHNDWALHNILIDGDNLQLIDWDTCGIYPEQEVKKGFEKQIKKRMKKISQMVKENNE